MSRLSVFIESLVFLIKLFFQSMLNHRASIKIKNVEFKNFNKNYYQYHDHDWY